MSKAKRKKLEWVELQEGVEGGFQRGPVRMYREKGRVMLVPPVERGDQMMSFEYHDLKKALALFEKLPEHAEGMLR